MQFRYYPILILIFHTHNSTHIHTCIPLTLWLGYTFNIYSSINTYTHLYFCLIFQSNGCLSIDPVMSKLSCKAFLLVRLSWSLLSWKISTLRPKVVCWPRPSFFWYSLQIQNDLINKELIWSKCVVFSLLVFVFRLLHHVYYLLLLHKITFQKQVAFV
jgi:hypothetical protein